MISVCITTRSMFSIMMDYVIVSLLQYDVTALNWQSRMSSLHITQTLQTSLSIQSYLQGITTLIDDQKRDSWRRT